jgi:hypothetical protein
VFSLGAGEVIAASFILECCRLAKVIFECTCYCVVGNGILKAGVMIACSKESDREDSETNGTGNIVMMLFLLPAKLNEISTLMSE